MGKKAEIDVSFVNLGNPLEITVYIIKKFTNITLSVPIEDEETKLNLYFDISLWCLKRFYEGPKDHHKEV